MRLSHTRLTVEIRRSFRLTDGSNRSGGHAGEIVNFSVFVGRLPATGTLGDVATLVFDVRFTPHEWTSIGHLVSYSNQAMTERRIKANMVGKNGMLSFRPLKILLMDQPRI